MGPPQALLSPSRTVRMKNSFNYFPLKQERPRASKTIDRFSTLNASKRFISTAQHFMVCSDMMFMVEIKQNFSQIFQSLVAFVFAKSFFETGPAMRPGYSTDGNVFSKLQQTVPIVPGVGSADLTLDLLVKIARRVACDAARCSRRRRRGESGRACKVQSLCVLCPNLFASTCEKWHLNFALFLTGSGTKDSRKRTKAAFGRSKLVLYFVFLFGKVSESNHQFQVVLERDPTHAF